MSAAALAAALAAGVAVLVPAPAGAGTARPQASLSASPARLSVHGAAARRVVLRNHGRIAVTVDAARAPLGRRSASSWIGVRPARVTIPPGGSRALTVRIDPPRAAAPGDHHAVVLLTSRPLRGARVAVRLRLGVVVRERIPGRLVSRLVPVRLRVRQAGRRRVLALAVANRGNVTEALGRGRVVVAVVRRGRIVARLHPRSRPVLPGGRALLTAVYRGAARGAATLVVSVRGGPTTRYRLRL